MAQTPIHLQHSYDYENRDDSENVFRHVSSKEGSISQRSTIESTADVGEAYEDLFLLQEIAFDLPEMEGMLLSTMSSMKHRNSFSLPAWFVDMLRASVHFIMMAGFIFTIGFIASFFMSAPTGFTGTVIWESPRAVGEPQHKLYVITKDDGSLSLEGTLYLSHHVFNPTPFTASLSSHVFVFYLPKSGQVNQRKEDCLNEALWTVPDNTTDFLRDSVKGIFKHDEKKSAVTPFPHVEGLDDHHDSDNEEEGADGVCTQHSLVTLRSVKAVNDDDIALPLEVRDNSLFDTFKSFLMLDNNLHLITNVQPGLNEISYLISVSERIPRNRDTEELIRFLTEDARDGNILLRVSSVEQRFETMFFGGDMLPQKFYPVNVPCTTIPYPSRQREVDKVRRQQHEYFNRQFNVLLNMDTLYNPRCPLSQGAADSSH
ncbi:putative integral membrane protein [Babesia bovis T2Bo]|uniref:Uncharacterized protein n=1 Tax=Babesia bovis TaxID=5865 RepID=A7APS0_BABBO|nr:putative integral membrane protein [Babesia bovis T2Bo]EDO08554.1 putative integral membrane protein [Babesia bovis T2Bo]|eukprot:XP_001612122.1 hypothetical protein [Babesia bovis T2Bo]